MKEELDESIRSQDFSKAAEIKESIRGLDEERDQLLKDNEPQVEEVKSERVGNFKNGFLSNSQSPKFHTFFQQFISLKRWLILLQNRYFVPFIIIKIAFIFQQFTFMFWAMWH